MDKDNDASNKDIIFTDIDLDSITCDINPAHFDGFLYEIADFSACALASFSLCSNMVLLSAATRPS